MLVIFLQNDALLLKTLTLYLNLLTLFNFLINLYLNFNSITGGVNTINNS